MAHPSAGPRARRPRGGGRRAALFTALLALVALLALAAPAQAAGPSTPEQIGKGLRSTPVYVDPGARDRLSTAEQHALAEDIASRGQPVYLVVLPRSAAYHKQTILSDIREATGRAGVYGVLLGDDFGAGSDRALLPGARAQSLARETERQASTVDAASLKDFAARAATAVETGADQGSGTVGSGGQGSGAAGTVLGVLVLGGLLLAVFYVARGGLRVRKEAAADLARVKATVDEDVTSYGEELERLDFTPSAPGGASAEEDAAMVSEYEEALDAYEEAKSAMAKVRSPRDVRAVTGALESGRFALATLRARRAGEPLPERRAPCFFDPRHGPSVKDRQWAPPGGEVRTVPICAADAARLDDGEPPLVRDVPTAYGRRPYWEAGPAYAPWAGGFFGGYGSALLPAMLAGTLLGSSLHTGAAWAAGPSLGGDGFGLGGHDFGGGFGGGGFDGGGFGGGF
ncbi:hypothetical protein [Streptomyces sp. ODS28]|uniref:hypothetical protein n=1 Tax=Streptomyces sp. ODS28 TaxID=3136688 RepID=UPI0031ED3A5D